MFMLEGILNTDVAVAGLLVMLAVAIGGLGFAYIADEEAKGRRIDWLEEPLATAEKPREVEKARLLKAA